MWKWMTKWMFTILAVTLITGCPNVELSKYATGVQTTVAEIQTDIDGLTIEQKNVRRRLETDNAIGSIKHLYIFSVTTGDVILYSTVDGKVTSSGKRLTPTQVSVSGRSERARVAIGMLTNIGGKLYRTPEVLQDDGTYGHSIPYLYWWDTKNVYHQQYVEGCMIHLSDSPIRGAKPKLILCSLGGLE